MSSSAVAVLVCPGCGHENRAAARFCEACATALGGSAGEHRKVVTLLFCDVVGSTALGESTDPEALRALLARYFERMRGIVERHGGSVEKFIGDAVLAVFGVPVVHEDDALRACRAAVQMRDAFPELGLQGRIGVNTGEVVTGTDERLAAGDAVNVAARLQTAAAPGDVLIGETTLALVLGAVEVEPVGPVAAKGKSESVPAFRLLAAHEPERRDELRFVGRVGELALLRAAWARALAERRCELVTVVGEAGVGKSRLVAQALAGIEARVVQGRCLPYGEGITYWPVVEAIKQLGARPSDPVAAAAIRFLLGDTEEASRAEEIAWAFRKLLEQEAPLLVVFDDVHCGEETFLDLVEGVALLSSGAPVLLLCVARPELLDRRPQWPVTLQLKPLPDGRVRELIGARAPDRLRERIARAAGGNPLFVTEMLAMAAHAGEDVSVPPTLRALLSARLDQLHEPERRVLEAGAVEGEIFHRGAVQALTPAEGQVTPRLASLIRRELIRSETAQISGEDGFRFRHLLLRDTAYDALPKSMRAELHQRFAVWLEQRGSGLVELDQILGYHLEQAVRYREELGLPDDEALRASAQRRLRAAGRRACLTHDDAAAVALLERAAALLPAGELDLDLELELLDELYWAERIDTAIRRATALSERSAAAGDRVGELCGQMHEQMTRTWSEPEGASDRLDALVDEALPVFDAAAGDAVLCLVHRARAFLLQIRCQFERAVEAYEKAAAYAARAGRAERFVHWRSLCRFWGTMPISDYLAWQDGLDERDRREWQLRQDRALALAMLGRIEEARGQLDALRAELADRGSTLALGAVSGEAGAGIELLAGDPAAAAALAEEGFRLHEQVGQRSSMSVYACIVAEACYRLGRLDEAEAWIGRAAALGASDDVTAQMPLRQVRAKMLARRGEHSEAERLAREGVAIGESVEALSHLADAYADLAEVLSLAGRAEAAADALKQALARYERKENLVMAERMRARLVELDRGARI